MPRPPDHLQTRCGLQLGDAHHAVGEHGEPVGRAGEGYDNGIGGAAGSSGDGMKLARGVEKQLPLTQRIFVFTRVHMHRTPVGIYELPEIVGLALKAVILIIFEIMDRIQLGYIQRLFRHSTFIYSVFHLMLQKDKYMRRSCNDILS